MPICSLSKRSLLPSLTVLKKDTNPKGSLPSHFKDYQIILRNSLFLGKNIIRFCIPELETPESVIVEELS